MKYKSLRKLKHDGVKRFTLKGKEKFAKVPTVHDGDTCDVAFYAGELLSDDSTDSDSDTDNSDSSNTDKLESKFVRYKCRMSGYDAPEQLK